MNLGFPNELVLMNSVSNETNGLIKLPVMFYIYSAMILILWATSFYKQLKETMQEKTSDLHDDDQ